MPKQYCKRVNIRSIHYITYCIYRCLDEKWSRSDVHALLAEFCDWEKDDIVRCATHIQERDKLAPVIDAMAHHIQQSIKRRDIRLKRAHVRVIQDGITRKRRPIVIAPMMQQIYDYIAKIGLQQLFDAKIAPHQYATIPGRGQLCGAKYNARWMHERVYTRRGAQIERSRPASTCAIAADVRKCYPSMSVGKLKALLRRDVRNADLLWLTFFLIDKMAREKANLRGRARLGGKPVRIADGHGLRGCRVKRGIAIGSTLSCSLCNYVMSYAWRYLMQDCVRWETRRGKRRRVRLVTHCGIYADNLHLFGRNKRDLMRALTMLEAYMRKTLGLRIRSDWRMYRLDTIDRQGKRHGSPVDGMGYVVYRDRVIMRGAIFLRARRKFARLQRAMQRRGKPSKRLCGSVIAYNGWFAHIDSRTWRRRNDYKYRVFATARRQMGQYMREEAAYARQIEIARCAAAG